jgi:putative membrane protein
MEEIKVPIYLITGFLESGKTSFLSFTLQQDYFQVEGKTLLVLCEEGEEEYDEEALKKSNTVVEVIDSEEELTPEQKVYFEYTCRGGDYIKTCTVPSPHLNGDDLEREKKMLKL